MSPARGMRALLAIAGREIAERGALFGVAAALGAGPFVAPRLGLGDRPLLAPFLGLVTVVAAAVLTGSSVIARDLADGRLAFFFARPVPWWSIWGGKHLAAIVLTVVSGLIVLVPAAWTADWAPPPARFWPMIAAPAVLAVMGGAHAFSVGYRSRSAWLALDLALALALGSAIAAVTRDLVRAGAFPTSLAFTSAVLWTAALSLTAATAIQVAWGRTDVQRGHRILSLVVWPSAALAVATFAAFAWWIRHPSPRDLTRVVYAVAAPTGPWLAVSGHVRWPRPRMMMPTFILEPGSGRAVRVANMGFVQSPRFSRDGSRVVWADDWWTEDPGLFTVDLRAARPGATRVPLPIGPGRIAAAALSGDGSEVAVAQPGVVTVFALGSPQPSSVTPIGEGRVLDLAFTARGLRVVTGPAAPTSVGVIEIREMAPSRPPVVVGRIPTRGNPFVRATPARDRMAVVHRPDHRPSVTLHDGDGTLVAELVREGEGAGTEIVLLADGGVAILQARPAPRVRLLSPDGTETATVDLGPGLATARLIPVGPRLVAVAVRREASDAASLIVDTASGQVVRREPGLAAASPPMTWWPLVSDALESPLFLDERDRVVRLDPATGERRVVIAADHGR